MFKSSRCSDYWFVGFVADGEFYSVKYTSNDIYFELEDDTREGCNKFNYVICGQRIEGTIIKHTTKIFKEEN